MPLMLNLIGVAIAFAVIIVLIHKRLNFGISLIIGSIVVGIFSLQKVEPIEIPMAMIEASFYSFDTNKINTQTIELALLMLGIYVLAKTMQETGAIKKLVKSLRTIFSQGGTLALIPAVYGLMPVPGGALLSAPMIDEEGNKYHLTKDQKNFLNIWFRHIWFPIYPVSLAMILICSTEFSNINIYSLVLVNIPAFITSIIIGMVMLKKIVDHSTEKTATSEKDYTGIVYLLPPTVPLLFYAILQQLGISQIQSFLIGVFFSIILLYYLTKTQRTTYISIIKKSLSWRLPLAIFGIMIFRKMFELSDASTVITNVIGMLPLPAVFMIVMIPLLLGTLTGYNLGAIALSYPLVEPFFHFVEINIVGLTSIIFISSLVGYLVSPIHLCNVLSSEYFKTDVTRMYKMFIPSAFILLLINTSIMMIL
ncbi:MAG: hypothetical protein DRN08_04990 [Thermoplasmata archaeon]|nr:MAG: hypothetical protein DRN08_04990 [Thermoplasmata archaeon]